MIFTHDFSIPVNTPKSTPKHDVMLVTKGLVYRVEFQFPAGCAGLAGIIVADGGFQVWPSTLGNWFATDNHVVAFDDMYTKFAEPFQLDFWGYNLDETYAHTIYVRIGMADKEIFQARFLPNVAYEMINRELEKVEAVKEEERQALIASPFPWLRGKE